MEEIWVDIKGYNGKYQVSNKGRIKSFSKYNKNGKGSILKGGFTKKTPQTYQYVCLIGENSVDKKNFYVHKLVAEHFCDNSQNYNEVNHIDGNTHNNCSSNLEWCTHKQNMEHASRTGVLSKGQEKYRGSNNTNSITVLQYTKDGKFIKEWGSVNEIMRETGIPAYSIFKCLNPNHCQKSSYGYIWKKKSEKQESQ